MTWCNCNIFYTYNQTYGDISIFLLHGSVLISINPNSDVQNIYVNLCFLFCGFNEISATIKTKKKIQVQRKFD